MTGKKRRRKHSEKRWAILVRGNRAFPQRYFAKDYLFGSSTSAKTFATREKARIWKRRSSYDKAYKKRMKIVRVQLTEV